MEKKKRERRRNRLPEGWLEEFNEKWGKKYPQIVKSWQANWAELSTYFKYPEEVRRLIYTTNAVEGFHRMLRKYTKTKTIYPTDDAVKRNGVCPSVIGE